MKWIGLGVQIRVGGYLWVGMDKVRTWNVTSISHIVVEIFLSVSYEYLMLFLWSLCIYIAVNTILMLY